MIPTLEILLYSKVYSSKLNTGVKKCRKGESLLDTTFFHKSRDLILRIPITLFQIAVPFLTVALSCPSVSMAEKEFQTSTFNQFIYAGMDTFRNEDVSTSVKMFDEALLKSPEMYPYLWQRGLSLYYANDYAKCAAQFNFDAKVNSNDYEETIWASICENGQRRQSSPSSEMLLSKSLPFRDQRAVMNDIQSVYNGLSTPESLLNSGVYGDDTNNSKGFFYTRLYMGLFYEARGLDGDAAKALDCMQRAVRSAYGSNHARDDYMVSVARVHYNLRKQQADPT
eukprot:gene20504-26598_t